MLADHHRGIVNELGVYSADFPRILLTLTVEAAGVAVAGLPALRPVLSLQEWAGVPLHLYCWALVTLS